MSSNHFLESEGNFRGFLILNPHFGYKVLILKKIDFLFRFISMGGFFQIYLEVFMFY